MDIGRRRFLAGSAALGALALSACQSTGASQTMAEPQPARSDRPYTLVYIAARDCPTCKFFEAKIEPGFLASPKAQLVDYRRLEFETLADITTPSVWPDDLVWIRDRYKLKSGTPRFYLIRDGEVVAQTIGAVNFREHIPPASVDV